MNDTRSMKYLKDLVYISIISIIIISNLLAIIVFRHAAFLSVLSTVIAIILSVVAIFYGFLSTSKMDAKIDEMQRAVFSYTSDIHEIRALLDRFENSTSSVMRLIPPERKEEIAEIESDIDRLRRSLAITTEKMLYNDKKKA